MSREASRFPSLDGLRAISIGLVILQHFDSSHQFGPNTYLWRFQLGDLGVRIFFVLSGFLITSLLIQEYDHHKKINLPKFYARRFLRIFPAYYFFLAVVAMISAAGLLSVEPLDFLWPSVYLSNYSDPIRLFAHTWSLSVEQQFYLIWPVALIILGKKKGAAAAIIFIIAAPIFRFALSLHDPSPPTIWARFELTGDALSAGCALAMLRHKLTQLPLYIRLMSTPSLLLAAITLLLLSMTHRWPLFWAGLGTALSNIITVFIVNYCIQPGKSIIFRTLNNPILIYIGLISYSLYIWQQFFAYSRFTTHFYTSLPLLIAAASFSYHFIERPALRLKSRYSEGDRGGSINKRETHGTQPSP